MTIRQEIAFENDIGQALLSQGAKNRATGTPTTGNGAIPG
jgi:hypothetical protein